jgi:hypothetical protein
VSWDDLESEIAELFAECAPVHVFDLDRFAPKGMGCEWPRCFARKVPGHGAHYCAAHAATANAQRMEKERIYSRERWRRILFATERCPLCERGIVVKGFGLCVHCARTRAGVAKRRAA